MFLCLFRMSIAVFGKFGKQLPRALRRVGHALFDSEARGFLALFDKLVIGRENVCTVTCDNTVYLLVDSILPQGAFKSLIPMLRLNLALGVNLSCLPVQFDADIDWGFPFFCDFSFLAEENDAESLSIHTAVNGL